MIWNHSKSTLPQTASNREERRWSKLAFLGALYYLMVYAVGGNSQYNRQVIWMGAGLLGLALVPFLSKHLRLSTLPREGVLLGLFLLWSTTGFFVAKDKFFFVRYLQLLSELTLIVMIVSLILKYSGAVKWFHLAFLGVTLVGVFSMGHPIAMESLTPTDQLRSELDSANAFGLGSAIGFLSVLALMRETKSLWLRAALVAGGLLAFYGVLLSASRTAFLALMVVAIMWPTLCLASTSRFTLTTLIGAIIVLLLAYGAYVFIVEKTYMGVRFMQSVNMEDNSTLGRLDLVRIGLQMFLNNPLFGCGLGDFGAASGTGYFAHNEFVEIAATTGLPGLVLYYSVYGVAWKRLSKSLRYLRDPLPRYRVNIARMALLVLLITGMVSTPNFLGRPSMFLLATVVGMAHWAERMARPVQGRVPIGPGLAAVPLGFPQWPAPVGHGIFGQARSIFGK